MSINMSVSDPAVADGRERARYIEDGRISRREPQYATNAPRPLTVDQLYERGFHDAAYAKRKYEAAFADYTYYQFGRPPSR